MDALYATLPKIECQRLCTACCTTFGMTNLEKDRLEAAGGPLKTKRIVLGTEDGRIVGVHNVVKGQCPFLVDGVCSVYVVRPIICRLWGVAKVFKCPHGCLPERFLSDEEAYAFMRKAQAISA